MTRMNEGAINAALMAITILVMVGTILFTAIKLHIEERRIEAAFRVEGRRDRSRFRKALNLPPENNVDELVDQIFRAEFGVEPVDHKARAAIRKAEGKEPA